MKSSASEISCLSEDTALSTSDLADSRSRQSSALDVYQFSYTEAA